MTTIFGRYLFRQTAGALLLILLSLSGVVWIALALRQLNLVTAQGRDTLTFLTMTTLALPNLIAVIAPVALLIAAIHTLNRLNGDSELIVLTSSGATMWTVARPLLTLALMVSLGVSLVNHIVMPWSLRTLREMVVEMRTDLIGQVIQPGRFSSLEANLTFHIRDRALNGELFGVLIHDTRDAKQAMSYLADRGIVQRQGVGSYLVMTGGHIVRKTDANEPAQIIQFDSYAVDLDRFETKGGAVELKPRERYFAELTKPGPHDADFKRQPGFFRAELHERFSNPLYAFAFVMIALAFAGQAKSNRQERWQAVTAAVVLGIAARASGLGVNNLVVVRANAVPLLYAIPLIAIFASMALIWVRSSPRPGISWSTKLKIATEDAIAKLPRWTSRRRSAGSSRGTKRSTA